MSEIEQKDETGARVSDVLHDEVGSPKRRKLDGEGFVLPSTPDIPVTSVHYPGSCDNRGMEQESASCDEKTEVASSSKTTPQEGGGQCSVQERTVGQYSRPDDNCGQGDGQLKGTSLGGPHLLENDGSHSQFSGSVGCEANSKGGRSSPCDSQLTLLTGGKVASGMVFGGGDNSDKKGQFTCVDSNMKQTMMWLLMKDLEQQSRPLYQNWAQRFSESERFEEFCNLRLDKLIEEAQSAEASLKQQKEELKNRLKIISRSLQDD